MQLRHLADCCFVVRDWGGALTYARAASSEFRNARAWIHFAGAQELTAMANVMIDTLGRLRDIESALVGAYARGVSVMAAMLLL